MTADTSDPVLRQVTDWINTWVIGENLCPFAAAPMEAGRVRVAHSSADDLDEVYRDFLAEVQRLLGSSPEQLETTVLAMSLPLSFSDYLDLLAACEQALVELGLEGVLQIASFHPDYVFADVSADDPANYSNRSPVPLLHLLRERSVSAALATVAQPERIPERNQAHLRRLGLAEIRQRLGLPD